MEAASTHPVGRDPFVGLSPLIEALQDLLFEIKWQFIGETHLLIQVQAERYESRL